MLRGCTPWACKTCNFRDELVPYEASEIDTMTISNVIEYIDIDIDL